MDIETGQHAWLAAYGELIVFTRQTNWTSGKSWEADRFDICTVNADGTGLKVLTESQANDVHGVR
ncbi:hypothetical protein QQZ08_001389 [Neonectria magnoliae]|uniref:Uncharacterized protein n=1 Tax=Neonectria magnoliae TaxID=2732573 RepID=A0ABR1IEW3_9HYPO